MREPADMAFESAGSRAYPNRQLACCSYLGDDEVLLMTTVGVLLAEVRIEPHRDISSLDQEKPHEPAALLADAAHLLLASGGAPRRIRPIAGDLLAPWESADITNGEYECQSGDRTNPKQLNRSRTSDTVKRPGPRHHRAVLVEHLECRADEEDRAFDDLPINKGEGVVKGKDLLSVALSSARCPRGLGTRARAGSHRISYGGVFSTNHQYGPTATMILLCDTRLCWVRERLLSPSVWLALTRTFQAALDERTCGYGFESAGSSTSESPACVLQLPLATMKCFDGTTVGVLLAEVRIEPAPRY